MTCSTAEAMRQRQKVIPLATGRVLEVGVGTGLNIPLYDPAKVTKLWCLDPSPQMIRIAKRIPCPLPSGVEFIGLPDDTIPLDDHSVDTIVITYTMCTIPDTNVALAQMRRVLRPGGRLVFCEHGVAPDLSVRRWQEFLNPVWKRFSGGCNLNRDIPSVIRSGGFKVTSLDAMYTGGWRPASFNYWGTASPV